MYEEMMKIIFPFDSTFYNIISTLVLVYLLWSLIDLFQTRHMPPSPWFGLPLLGHSMYLSMRVHEDVANLAQRYGPVISLRLGTLRVVFVNGPDAVRDVLIKKSADFSGRPSYPSFRIFDMNGKGVACSDGLVWKVHRKLLMSSLRDKLSDQAGIENRVMREVKILLESFSKTEARPLNPEKLITLCISNVICGVGFDKHFDGSEEDYKCFISTIKYIAKEVTQAGFVDFLPVPSLIANVLLSRFREQVHKQHAVTSRYVREHQEYAHSHNDSPKDLIDGMLQAKAKAMEEAKENVTQILSNEFLSTTARDIFGAGFETTTTTLRWALLYLVNHPEYQEAIQSELDKVIPPDQLPSLNNRNDLPLLQAAVLETLRLSSIFPLLLPHRSIRDTNIMGYHIPKDTSVFVNAWSVHMNPKCWENPKEFNPCRFIDVDGNLVTKISNFYPFSAGHRMCPGDSLAKVQLFLLLGSILHTYKVEHQKGVSVLNEEGDLGFVLLPKPYEIVFVKRRS